MESTILNWDISIYYFIYVNISRDQCRIWVLTLCLHFTSMLMLPNITRLTAIILELIGKHEEPANTSTEQTQLLNKAKQSKNLNVQYYNWQMNMLLPVMPTYKINQRWQKKYVIKH